MASDAMAQSFNKAYTGLRPELVSEVAGANLAILDLGCATGANGRYLLDKGLASNVYGAEYDEAMAAEASKYYHYVAVGDLDLPATLNGLGDQQYDFIIAGDILEHLNNPWLLLQTLKGLLKPDGKVIISLPNMQHIDVFIHLFLKHTWPINNRGLFDKTHRRNFTIKDMHALTAQAELKIVKVKNMFRYRDDPKSKFPWYGPLLKRLLKRYYTFQYVLVCTHA